MELTYKKDKLTIDAGYEIIDNAASIVTVRSDIIGANIFGILTLSNGLTKTIQFVHKTNGLYYGKLIILEHEVAVLNGAAFKLQIGDASFVKTSNVVLPKFDIPSINLSVKRVHDTELADMHKEIAELKQTLNSLAKGYKLGIEIKGDTSYIKPGMIPVAIDGGAFIAAFPFQDTVKRVNGKDPVDNSVELKPYDIPYRDSNLHDYLVDLTKALSEVSDLTRNVADQLSKLRHRVDDLDYRFEQYKNKGTL